MRYLNDVVVTYKATDKLTLVTEANYIKDDFFRAEGWGIAQYASYALNDNFTLNARAEVYRDSKPFFVAAFPNNLDFVNAQLGFTNTAFTTAKPVTYGEITAGFTYKPSETGPLSTIMFRPEIRYDHSLNGVKPYNGGKDINNFTFAGDVILAF
jgi:hypothetical protein